MLPTLLIALGTALVYTVRDVLPALITRAGLDSLIANPHATAPIAGVTDLAYALVAITLVVLLAGAIVYRFACTGDSPVTDGYLSIALVIGAFAELQYAFYPGVYAGLVTTGDALPLRPSACCCWASTRSSGPTFGPCDVPTPRWTACV